MHFTDAEVGLYIRLLCVQWSTGKIPCDNHELSSYGKGDTKVDRVKAKFEVGKDGFLRNKRMELEREKQENYRKSRSDNGKQGGRPPKAHGLHTVLKTKAQESSPSPSPVLSLSQAEIPSWEEFWGYCQTQACLLPAEWYARDKWEAGNQDNWKGKTNWQAYARRCKAWWEGDGKPATRPSKNGKAKPLLTAKEERIAEIKHDLSWITARDTRERLKAELETLTK